VSILTSFIVMALLRTAIVFSRGGIKPTDTVIALTIVLVPLSIGSFAVAAGALGLFLYEVLSLAAYKYPKLKEQLDRIPTLEG